MSALENDRTVEPLKDQIFGDDGAGASGKQGRTRRPFFDSLEDLAMDIKNISFSNLLSLPAICQRQRQS